MSPAKIIAALSLPIVAVSSVMYAAGPMTLRAPEVIAAFGAGSCAVGFGLFAYIFGEQHLVPTPWVRRLLMEAGEATVATGFLILVMLVGLVSSTVLTPWGGPTVDALLSWPEVAVGVRQVDAYATAERVGILPTLAAVYLSARPQVALACLWWVFVGRDARPIWTAAVTLALCVAVGIPLYVLLPAEGPVSWYGVGEPGPWHGSWSAMRAGPFVVRELDGVIAAPSFHVIFAGLLTRMWARTPLGIAAAIVNGAMLLATWVVGAHYATDLIVGGLLFVGAAFVSDRILEKTYKGGVR